MAKLKKKAAKKRMHGGNAPKRSLYPNAKLISTFDDHDTNTDYDLWFTVRRKGWNNFKLVCRQKRTKGNYWFAYGRNFVEEDLRIYSQGDHKKLEEHHPKLFQSVVRFIAKNYK